MEIYIGKRMSLSPSHTVDKLGHTITGEQPCKVVSINRKHRHFTAEFDFDGQKIREAYNFSFHRMPGERHEKMLIW